MSAHIGIAGPFATVDIGHLIGGDANGLPRGTPGAPLLTTLASELIDRGYRVTAFTLSNDLAAGGPRHVEGKNRFSIFYVPARRRAWRPVGGRPGRIVDLYRHERLGLVNAMRCAAPQVVHAHWAYEYALAAIASAIPHVLTSHDSPYAVARFFSRSRPTQSLYRWLRVLMARKALREAECVTAVSPYMQDEIRGLTRVDVQVVPNPVDAIAFALGRKRELSGNPRFAMVCNGWDKRKNPQAALTAFARFRASRPTAQLHLFGFDFGQGEKAQGWCAERGYGDGIVFHGAVPHHDLLRHVSEMDVLVHPSLEETFGMVIAEAMALGLPVIAGARSGAVPWVLGGTGLLCDVSDADAIAAAMAAVIEPARYAAMSTAGIRQVEQRFSVDRVVHMFEQLYAAALLRKGHA